MGRVKLDGFQCERCGHTWVPQRGNLTPELKKLLEIAGPKVCPRCKSPYWDTPRESKTKGKGG